MRASSLTLAGFLATAVAVLGLLGVLTSYIAPLPLERAMQREAVLDRLAAGADYATLKPELADSAEAVKPGPDLAARIAAERPAMRARLQAQADEAGTRLRLMLVVATVMVAAFGAAMLGLGRRVR